MSLLSIGFAFGVQQSRQDDSATICGRVLDAEGEPIDLVYVEALSSRGRGLVRVQTGPDGSYRLPVEREDAYLVSIAVIDPARDRGFHIAGERGLDLVLPSAQRWTFSVVDDADGSPIERFGIAIADKPGRGVHGGIDGMDIDLRDHLRGEATSHADPSRNRVRVQAPGRASIEIDVVGDAGSSRRQTIRLKVGGSVVGRVAAGDRPLEAAQVALSRGALLAREGWSPDPPEDAWFGRNYPCDLGEYDGRLRVVRTDAAGSFRITDLPTGTYDVVVASESLGPRKQKRVRVEAGRVRDLGTLVLEAPAAVRVRVELGAPSSFEGIEVALDGDLRGARAVSASGELRIDGLGAGLHSITLKPNRFLLQAESREVRLAPGADAEVLFDLSSFLPSRLKVRVTRNGKPFEAGLVQAHVTSGTGEWVRNMLVCDAEGWFTDELPGGSELGLFALSRDRLIVGRLPAQTIAKGVEVRLDVAVDPGFLEIVLPPSIDVPEQGELEVSLRRGEEAAQTYVAKTELNLMRYGAPLWNGRRCDLGPLEPGEYVVGVAAEEHALDPEGYSLRPSRTLLRGFRTKCVVVAGRRTTVDIVE